MDKRYQVFVSSTFRDLLEERQAVTTALLEMDAIPAGMELFPAANEDAWDLIQRVIEQSDYYVLIVGGRYGSIDAAGIGYTEREYDFAMKHGVPVLAFLHEHPETIPAGKIDLSEQAQQKLAAFRAKVEKEHHCKYWNDPEQLGSRVTRGLLHQTKTTPRVGWVRADRLGGPEALAELNRLRNQVDTLNQELADLRTGPPKGTESLVQGDDEIRLEFACAAYSDEDLAAIQAGQDVHYSTYHLPFKLTVNEMLSGCGPVLLQDATEQTMKRAMEVRAHELLQERDKWYQKHQATDLRMRDGSFQSVKIQFIALGMIEKSVRKRPPSDKANYWTLTPYGEASLIQIRAIRKKPKGAG